MNAFRVATQLIFPSMSQSLRHDVLDGQIAGFDSAGDVTAVHRITVFQRVEQVATITWAEVV